MNVETLQLSRTTLVPAPAKVQTGEKTYQVDPTSTTGQKFNRWASQGGAPVYYGDRRSAPGRRLSFEGAAARRDMELVGAPELCLAMRTDQADSQAAAATPGELMYVELPLLSIAARIQKGHRLRLSLAGSDAGNFATLTETPATWTFSLGGAGGSTLRIPMKAWSPR